jgi:hypothetical protein
MPTETFTYTGSEQTWEVPSNVTQVRVRLWGAGGGASANADGTNSDRTAGGYVEGDLAVSPGETLRLYVGGTGQDAEANTVSSQRAGGWPNGADGAVATASNNDNPTARAYAAGAGGSSDIRQGGGTTSDIVALAGGGGGGSAADEEGTTEVGGVEPGGDGGGAAEDGGGGGGGTGGGATGFDGEQGTTSATDGSGANAAAAGGSGGGGLNGGGGGNSSTFGGDPSADGGGGGDGATTGLSSTSVTVGGGNSGDGQIEIEYTVPPANLTVDQTDFRSALISWDAVSGADEYNVYRDGTQIATVSAGTTSYDDTALSPETSYSWTVTTVAGGSESGDSNTASTTTGGAAPTGVSLDATVEDEITVSWTDNATAEAGYEVHTATSSGVDTSGTPAATTGADATSATVTGLADGERYYIRVVAVDGDDDRGIDSAEVDAVTVLPAPTGLTVDAVSATTADISWVNNHDTGTETVQYKPTSASSWTDAATGLSLSTASYQLTGLRTGEAYDVRVAAVTADDLSLDNSNFDVAPGETWAFSKPLTVEDSEFSKPLDNAGTVQPDDQQ